MKGMLITMAIYLIASCLYVIISALILYWQLVVNHRDQGWLTLYLSLATLIYVLMAFTYAINVV